MDWKQELVKKIEMVQDEKYTRGVYDMALDITAQIYHIFHENNTLNDMGDAYFPEIEITEYLYNAIKYGTK